MITNYIIYGQTTFLCGDNLSFFIYFVTAQAALMIVFHAFQSYSIKIQRGHSTEHVWVISRRYSDFAELDNGLKSAAISLSLPPKKVFGNTSREFIAERQQKLQVNFK